jgi:nucleoside 2-deoxyribosyltransferase
MKKIYLAIPYTFNPQKSFDIANEVSAGLMLEGNLVFSPISHSHCIADFLPPAVKTDSHWWMRFDLPMVEWADELHVVMIGENAHELIARSKGVLMEITHAEMRGKTIKYIQYAD